MTKTAVKTNKRIRRTGEGKLHERPKKSRLAPLYDLVEHAEDIGPPDLSENYEHYLYGGPKQSDALESDIIEPEGKEVAKAAVKEKPTSVSKGKLAGRKVRDKASIFRLDEQAVDMGISDLAENLDHYLYGTPKQGSKSKRAKMSGQIVKERKKRLAEEKRALLEQRKKSPIFRLYDLAVDTGYTDLAENLDYYLYGAPEEDA